VLEVGVGSGRIAVPTALAGVPVVGVDRSETMLDLAWARALPHRVPLELVAADMRDLPELGRFPLITVPFRALLHLRDDGERLAVLRALHERLEPGGTLAFDVFHPDRLDIEETHGRWLEREPGILERAEWYPADRHLTQSAPVASDFTRANREELARARPRIVIDGLSLYNPALAMDRYPELRLWLAQYQEVARTPTTVIYRLSAAPARPPLPEKR